MPRRPLRLSKTGFERLWQAVHRARAASTTIGGAPREELEAILMDHARLAGTVNR